MTQVIKISKAGINVGTATDPNDFIFDSTLNTFKILATGTVTGSITADAQQITVAHGQASIPAVYALCKFPDGKVTVPNGFEMANLDRYWVVNVNATNVIFEFYKGAAANYGPVVKYYVFEAPL